ncbi:hypothetical protein Ancab_017770 [Ancistrocladus abbreviatus]
MTYFLPTLLLSITFINQDQQSYPTCSGDQHLILLHNMVNTKWSLLGRLRKAVDKLRFLWIFNLNPSWRFVSLIRGSIGKKPRRLSFSDRPGLRACTDDDGGAGAHTSPTLLTRTTSCLSDEDIDKKAEKFIANFYLQQRLQRQISLELRYCRASSFDLTPSSSSTPSPILMGNYEA